MKRSFAQIRIGLYVTVAAFACSGAAGAQQLVPELSDAQQAVTRADRADADQYAPDLLDSARRYLEQAQAASLNRSDRKLVPVLASRAVLDADLARARSAEALANAQLAQRRAEVRQLQRTLGTGEEGAQP